MSDARQGSQDDYLLLKARARWLIKRAGGVDAAAAITRVSKSMLSDYQNPGKMDAFMPADVIFDLEGSIGEAPVSQTLVDFASASEAPHSPAGRMHRVQEIIKESAEAAVALGNGDTEATLREIAEAKEALAKAERDILARRCGPREVRDVS